MNGQGQVLVGDIGGTKVLLQVAQAGAAGRVLHERRYHSSVHDDFDGIVREFLQTLPDSVPRSFRSACFGVAGPITDTARGQRARLTNLPWVIDTEHVGAVFGIAKVKLINDFQATGYGIEVLRPDDLLVLQAGTVQPGATRIIIGAGTGLGQAILFRQDGRYEVLATEGGHADFAPNDELQMELWKHLRAHFGHVSYERVVSGPGLVGIYTFLREYGVARERPELAAAMGAGDPAAVIADAALSGSDALAQNALELFVSVYGAQAGNVALATLAYGGVYIAGGIAPKIADQLTRGEFMRAFRAKGRMSSLVSAMPVYVVMNPNVGVLGAASVASRL